MNTTGNGEKSSVEKGSGNTITIVANIAEQQPKRFATQAMMLSYWLEITHWIGSVPKLLKYQLLKQIFKHFDAELIISKIGLIWESDLTHLFKLTAVFVIIVAVQI